MYSQTFALLGLAPIVLAKVQFLGVAIAGGDFGCEIDGSCPTGSVQFPLEDGPGQMQHFVEDDGMNILRLPTSWQFLVNNQLGGGVDESNLAKYDQLMQACLDTGAHCMIDIHNFAHFNGEVIGQDGPTDEQFVSLWSQLATKYASNEEVIFELMNEPHDLDIGVWAQTCQKVVTAIREAGATSQMILLPGTNFDSAATLVSSGSADALLAITNPDGGTDNLLLDIHKYLDEDNSGTHSECTTDNVDAFTSVVEFLREKGRKGLVSETGASDDASCFTAFCAQNNFINKNSDVFVGLIGWGAGSFDASYVLSLTPSKQKGVFVDSELMTQCILEPWVESPNGSVKSPSTSTSTSTTTVQSSAAVTTTKAAGATNTAEVDSQDITIVDTSLVITPSRSGTASTLLIATGVPPAGGSSGLAMATDDSRFTFTETPSPTVAAAGTEASVPASGGVPTIGVAGRLLWGACSVVVALIV